MTDASKENKGIDPSDEKLVKDIAALARIDIEPAEVPMYAAQMRSILNYLEDLKDIDLTGIDPTVQIHPLELPFGPDEVERGLPIDAALNLSLRRRGDLLSVPRIVNPEEEAEAGE